MFLGTVILEFEIHSGYVLAFVFVLLALVWGFLPFPSTSEFL